MPNERCRQMEQLSREHDEGMAFADRISELASDGSEESLAEGVRLVQAYYQEELEQHLQHEEQTIFAPIVQFHREHFSLCVRLGTEHGLLRTMATGMRLETAQRDLPAFADILRKHTVAEEEELLPLVESLFTPEQLDAVMHFTPLPGTPHGRGPAN
ncbi:hemerythrin domain-containing protein [Thioalkalivibrio sp.]|uniref:hemerythrin domain-containing protein n=1 Tax=Thioalkalivibrio sp. TaxID=2093813 RepID=UPI0012D5456A|nr:hemerythrin domain-containing protein [Thioalkalivibrio sp.]TVP79451.1 MAG: hemerythrin domain-containing protein [Thioalkalivibrio sp.]